MALSFLPIITYLWHPTLISSMKCLYFSLWKYSFCCRFLNCLFALSFELSCLFVWYYFFAYKVLVFSFILLTYSWFTVLCSFLLNSKVIQFCVYVCVCVCVCVCFFIFFSFMVLACYDFIFFFSLFCFCFLWLFFYIFKLLFYHSRWTDMLLYVEIHWWGAQYGPHYGKMAFCQ